MSSNNKTIVLFGASGNIGTPLLDRLRRDIRESNHSVTLRVACRSQDSVKDWEGLDFHRLVMGQQDSFDTAVAGTSVVFIVIPQKVVHNAIDFVKPIADACTKHGVNDLVVVGTGNAKAYEMGRRFLIAEQYLREHFNVTVINPAVLSSSPDLNGPSPPSFDILADFYNGAKFSIVHLEDLAEACSRVLLSSEEEGLRAGQSYTVSSDNRSFSISEIADMYHAHQGGEKLPVYPLGTDDIRGIFLDDGYSAESAELIAGMFQDASHGCFDISETNDFQLITGHEPRSITSFIEANVKAQQVQA